MKNFFYIIFMTLFISSCTSVHKTIKQPFSSVQIKMNDFDLSEQKSASALSVTTLGIDFGRLFLTKTGSAGGITSVPILGQYLSDPTTSYAMYELLDNNSSGDFVFYPQINKKTTCPILGVCLITRITKVDVKARVGTFK